jgi:hypothetical protein
MDKPRQIIRKLECEIAPECVLDGSGIIKITAHQHMRARPNSAWRRLTSCFLECVLYDEKGGRLGTVYGNYDSFFSSAKQKRQQLRQAYHEVAKYFQDKGLKVESRRVNSYI